jgi:hypothetical protein
MELRKKARSGNEEGGRKERQHESGAARGKMERKENKERKKERCKREGRFKRRIRG